MQTGNKKRVFRIVPLIFALCLLLCGAWLNPAGASAKADTAPPDITVWPNSELPMTELVLMVQTSDNSGIEEVRWTEGKKDAAYFEGGKGTKLKRNSFGKSSVIVKENGYYTFYAKDKKGNGSVAVYEVTNIDNTKPKLSLKVRTVKEESTIFVTASDDREVWDVRYLKGEVSDPDSDAWFDRGTDITDQDSFTVKSTGTYSVRVQDQAGNCEIKTISIEGEELRAVWVSYLEFSKKGYKEADFKKYIDDMFDNIADMNMNAVIVQVRPFSDAMYESKYFPWSVFASGTQGKDPGFDPLEIMVEAAHKRGLAIHAWMNPYRITNNTADYTTLAKDNPARMWMEDNDSSNDRNVLVYDGKLYYNPASPEVRELITNGIREVVENYDVDGIHFDDYFYPSLGTKYAEIFDSLEYEAYKADAGKNAMSIADWRRNNVNTLVKGIYSAIKEIDESVEFGISPGGFLDYLKEETRYYVDFETWMSEPGYIDYICPQIYWSFSHSKYPYDTTLDRWLSYRTCPEVKVYVGIATYKAGLKTEEKDWYQDEDILKNQILYARDTGEVDGFMFFRYAFFYTSQTQDAVEQLLEVMD